MQYFSFKAGATLRQVGATICGLVIGTAVLADEGLRLAQAVLDRPDGRDLTSVVRMALEEPNRAKRVRELIAFRTRRAAGEAVNLVRFTDPPDISGTGLLSQDKADGSNEQWLYLPELDRVRRIAGERKGGRFVGSDIYYEDLQERKAAQDRHRLLGKEVVGGIECQILESVPIDPGSSVYRKRISWVDPQTALVHRVDYFEKDDAQPSKRWLLLARKKIQGYWTVTDSRVTDLASGHATRMTVSVALYDRKLPAKLFSPQALADESLEAEYRP